MLADTQRSGTRLNKPHPFNHLQTLYFEQKTFFYLITDAVTFAIEKDPRTAGRFKVKRALMRQRRVAYVAARGPGRVGGQGRFWGREKE